MDRTASKARILCHAALATTLALAPTTGSAQEGGSLTQTTGACDGVSRMVSAQANETVEVVFPNGGSVTLAPGASVEVGCTAAGGITVTLGAGILRVAAGPETPPAVVRTQDAAVTLDDGAAVVAAEGGVTRVHLLTGSGLAIAAGGAERRLFRPGFEVIMADGTLSRPRRMSAEEVVADLRRINPGLATGAPPRRAAPAAASGQVTDVDADALAGAIGVGTLGTALPPLEAEFEDGDDLPPTDEDVDLPPTDEDIDPPPVIVTPEPPGFDEGLGSVDLAGDFDATAGVDTNLVVEGNTSSSLGASLIRLQEAQDAEGYLLSDFPEAFGSGGVVRRTFGPTTNSIFGTADLTQTLGNGSLVSSIAGEQGNGLAYFLGTSVFGLRDVSVYSGEQDGVFLFGNLSVSTTNGVFSTSSLHPDASSIRAHTGLGLAVGDSEPTTGVGVFAEGVAFGNITSGGTRDDTNFVFIELAPAVAYHFSGDLYEAHGQTCVVCLDEWDFYAQFAENELQRLYADASRPLPPGSDLSKLYDVDVVDEGGSAAAVLRDPNERRRIIFATGDLDGLVDDPTPGSVVDNFYLSAGMAGDILGGVDDDLMLGMDRDSGALRAFARGETWTELDERAGGFGLDGDDLSDSGLFVIYPTGAVLDTESTAKVLHADVGLVGQGTAQVSTISATIGEVKFEFSNLDPDNPTNTEADAFLTARTVGSSQGLNEQGLTAASTLIAGDVISTAAGGGNPNPDFTDPGRLGFLVLENAGDVFVNGALDKTLPGGNDTGVLPGGEERPVGVAGPGDKTFALARLGVGVTSTAIPSRRGFSGETVGYAAGFVEVETGTGVSLARLSATEEPNLVFSGFSPELNEVSASLTWDEGTLALGGAGGRSAYLDDDRFGLRSRTSGTDVAMVSGELVVDGMAEAGPAPRDYDYVKWGFFFGDVKAGDDGGRRHVHLGSFAAGQRLASAAGLSVTGPVTYEGHAVGNVRNGNRVYTALGTFRDTFNFGDREWSGQATVNFDGRTLTGPSSATLNGYTGTLAGAGGFSGTLNGHLVGPMIDYKGRGSAPAGIVGGFGIRDAGTNYRATGTFAGEQSGQ